MLLVVTHAVPFDESFIPSVSFVMNAEPPRMANLFFFVLLKFVVPEVLHEYTEATVVEA